jgi:hypothetical protein
MLQYKCQQYGSYHTTFHMLPRYPMAVEIFCFDFCSCCCSASVIQWVPRLTNAKHVFEEHVASLCTWSLGTSHTHTEDSCKIFNGQWNSIEHFPVLSVTLVSNWVLTKECNWKSKKRKQAHKHRCLRSGWMWMKFPETSIFDELVGREKFQLLWTAITL